MVVAMTAVCLLLQIWEKELEGGKMLLPTAYPLQGFPNFKMPYFFVGDEAFALKS